MITPRSMSLRQASNFDRGSYITCMYLCLLFKVLVEYNLYLCACSKRDSEVSMFLYALRGDTRLGYISTW